ncbi:hypothetical protein PAUR_a0649 [Pseudoalteromonas aurantia 208]|uniref:Uncharacterized protein n=1 Tax=Pseudoalteromonas aurantia 208 TaxID=1314867 RepID=A0ABR9E970_9GAMM|nr:hypothetical protein [Pseudoalteromonas aurantia 208]
MVLSSRAKYRYFFDENKKEATASFFIDYKSSTMLWLFFTLQISI